MSRVDETPDEYPDRLPDDSRTDIAVSLGTILANAVPGLGGVVAGVLSEWSAARRYARVQEVLEDMALRLANVRSEASEVYVRSDEFADLLDQTLRRAAHERSEEKRRLYAAFLAGAVTSPGEPYHEQLRFLRTLEELQPDHIRVIHAMLQAPSEEALRGGSGGILNTLTRRLPGMQRERIEDLARQLTDELRVVTIGPSLNTMMTAHGAEDLRSRFTPYGQRLVSYIRSAEEGASR